MRIRESQKGEKPHKSLIRPFVMAGCGARWPGAPPAIAYKLIDAAQARWRAVNAPHLVALVRAGAVFRKGKLYERPADIRLADSGGVYETGSEVA